MSQTSLSELLRLECPPIAITFADAPPSGMKRVANTEPASCGYWRRAAQGEAFYTVPDDHKSCPIGAHTHNVAMTPAESAALMDLVKTMVGLSYIKMEELPQIPQRLTPLKVAIYAPLSASAAHPDVVLVRGNAQQLMLLTEAAQLAGVAGASAPMGRPTCAVLPAAINGNRSAVSFGCVGNRIYTGAAEEDAYFAFPGSHLEVMTDTLQTIIRANNTLEQFHRERAASITS